MALELMALSPWEANADQVAMADKIRMHMVGTMEEAETFAVTPEICAILEGAADDYPDPDMHLSDILTNHGLAVFTDPIPDPGVEPNFGNIRAISWALLDGDDPVARNIKGPLDHPAVAVIGYVDTRGIPGIPERELANYPRIYPVVSAIWRVDVAGGGMPVRDLDAQLNRAPYVKILMAFWAIMRQRLAVSEEPTVRVHAKELARAQRKHPNLNTGVRVVRMRPAPRSQYLGDHGFNRIGLDKQWPVRSHWKNHWYPKEQQHKPILILTYFKGNPDAPLIHAERIYLPPKPRP